MIVAGGEEKGDGLVALFCRSVVESRRGGIPVVRSRSVVRTETDGRSLGHSFFVLIKKQPRKKRYVSPCHLPSLLRIPLTTSIKSSSILFCRFSIDSSRLAHSKFPNVDSFSSVSPAVSSSHNPSDS